MDRGHIAPGRDAIPSHLKDGYRMEQVEFVGVFPSSSGGSPRPRWSTTTTRMAGDWRRGPAGAMMG
jgi:hypothetical protein